MTTVHLIADTLMEVPAMDDSMEMASPYQGQADDFDIDIDLMEDQLSNMDSDMMGAEEFTNTSQHDTRNNDAIYDADMADEPSEGSMIDADNYADEDNDIDVQYDEPYEEEMIESEPVAQADIAVSSIQLDLMASNENAAGPVQEDATIPIAEPLEAAPQDSNDAVEIAPAQHGAPVSGADDPGTQAELSTTIDGLPTEPSAIVKNTDISGNHENPELVGKANEVSQPSVSETEVRTASNEGLETSQIKSSPQRGRIDIKADATVHPEVQPESEENHKAAPTEDSLHNVTYTDETLHPVKILYQNSEIALFPPLEGDSAETFFLPDEDVAYDNIGELFKQLREVLEDSVGTDVLVIDVDPLGIQMTEDSSHTSQVTLYQILDLYLRLCRNDGIDEPDALYLTLSSKRAFSDEILELNTAAIAGKTLSELQSELHSWDEYDEAGPGSEEDPEARGAEEHEDELYYTGEVQKEDTSRDTQPVAGPEGEEASAQAPVASQTETGRAQDENGTASGEQEAESAAESAIHAIQPQSEELEQHEEYRDNQAAEYHDGPDGPTEEHYDSDGPHSDSSATVAGFTGESEIKGSIHDASLEHGHVGTGQNDNGNHYEEDHGNGELEGEEYQEHEHMSPYEDPGVSQADITVGETGDAEIQKPDDQVPVLDEEDADELDAPPTNEIVPTGDADIQQPEDQVSVPDEEDADELDAPPTNEIVPTGAAEIQKPDDQVPVLDEEVADELDAPPTNEIVPAVSLQGGNDDVSQDQTARSLRGELQDASGTKEQTPEPTNDLPGSAEELLQTPLGVKESDTLDDFEGIDYDELEDGSVASATAGDEDADEQEFDQNENHFGDYETYVEETEAVEVSGDPSLTDSPNNNMSSKRSREDEDDWDLEEPTLETKRRRPS
ncbi:uncharacterized protein N7515_007371 [Penicillium bovifimosum]|uniref:Uncharacterized protein n=1 Tax=Penicillium bovifimosum TaxID=126998 RepID=A0A9W9GWI1_9EURO|nr:uncharacterized protein N7515_007371 [Penicillium bovifimosum]KAJ5131332.1 hypothetical protein N7515_007371 [Penicillium bovifimosum]